MLSPRGTGLVLRDALRWEETREVAETAEDTGYAALFVPEISGREAFSTLTGLSGATTRLAVGTGVVPMDVRRPETTAMAAATVQELSGGRLVLGIGAGHQPPGATPGPRARLREYVRVVRSAMGGEPTSSALYGIDGFLLDLRPDEPPPIWIAALRDRMVRLAGEVADGVLLNWCTPERVRRARAAVEAAAAGAGRDPSAVTVAVYVRACVGPPPATALLALQEMTGRYASLPNYLAQLDALDLGADARAAAAAFQAGRPQDVPERLVDRLCVRGSREAWRAREAEFHAAGADLVLCYPVAALQPLSSVLGTALACAPSPAVER